jgi:hypothetical protein
MYNIIKMIISCFTLGLLSCGGGSAVTAVSINAEETQVPMGKTTVITASSSQSIIENVTGEKVSFSFRTNESGGTLDIVNDRLDGNGEARIIYRAGTRPGVDVIQASFGSGAVATVSITVGDGSPVGPIEISQIGATTVRILARDARGVPLVGANVDLSISSGSIIPTSGTTNSNGILEANFTLPAGVSNAQVTAIIQGISASATVSTSSTSVARINLSQRGTTVQATALDRSGRPVSNVLINFSIRGAGTVTPANGTTNDNGIIVVSFTLPAGTNSTQIVATSGTVTSSLTVNRVPTQVASIQLEQFGYSIFATVFDSSGQPVPGAMLNFRITTGTITPASTSSDNNGVAQATFSLPERAESAQVMVSSGTVSNTLNVQRPARTSTNIQSKYKPLAADMSACSIHLEQHNSTALIWIYDCEGNPVPNAQMNAEIFGGLLSNSHVVTDHNGEAVIQFSLQADADRSRLIVNGAGLSAAIDIQ